jgi:hypothetical protein
MGCCTSKQFLFFFFAVIYPRITITAQNFGSRLYFRLQVLNQAYQVGPYLASPDSPEDTRTVGFRYIVSIIMRQ